MSADEPTRPGRTIDLTIDLPTDPDTVWRLLTDPAGLAEWFAPQVEGSGAPGGTLTLSWGSEMSWNLQVARSERGRLVRWQDDFSAYRQPGHSSPRAPGCARWRTPCSVPVRPEPRGLAASGGASQVSGTRRRRATHARSRDHRG